jgi:hypothetical protein
MGGLSVGKSPQRRAGRRRVDPVAYNSISAAGSQGVRMVPWPGIGGVVQVLPWQRPQGQQPTLFSSAFEGPSHDRAKRKPASIVPMEGPVDGIAGRPGRPGCSGLISGG